MEDTISVRPTLIRGASAATGSSWRPCRQGRQPEDPEGSERAVLVFMDEGQAEALRAETGRFPASEGFVVGATDLEGLRAILWAWKLERVALRGPEPEAVSELEADTFCVMLEDGDLERLAV